MQPRTLVAAELSASESNQVGGFRKQPGRARDTLLHMKLAVAALLGAFALPLAGCSTEVTGNEDGPSYREYEPVDDYQPPAYNDPVQGPRGWCEDVTSYDYNWKNDMLCRRRDGSVFYTDYAGAARFEARQ